MYICDLKKYLLNPSYKVVFRIQYRDLIIKTEKLLISSGWRWRDTDKNVCLVENKGLFQGIESMSMYSNYHRDEPMVLSYSRYSESSIFDGVDYDILITEEALDLMEQVLNPKPNYKPKKIIREL